MRVFLVIVALVRESVALGGQCNLPTEQEVQRILQEQVDTLLPEGVAKMKATSMEMHFVCLATVALEKYSYASIVINYTLDSSPDDIITGQFQTVCSSKGTWGNAGELLRSGQQLSMPFEIETQYRCSSCTFQPPGPNYDEASNCQLCAPECISMGGGFCTGHTAHDCCPFFNNDTSACVDECTTINPQFGPNEDSICMCSISCHPGFTRNNVNCTCDLADGCEAAGQPCGDRGTCTNDASQSPYYTCQCNLGYTGRNCTIPVIDCDEGCLECDTTRGCCANCSDGYSHNGNCTCLVERSSSLALIIGLSVGVPLTIVVILALTSLLVYSIYRVLAKKKMKKASVAHCYDDDAFNNPIYISPKEL